MYVHNLNPFLLQFSGSFGIRWYGLAYLAGFVCAYLVFLYGVKLGNLKLSKEEVGDIIFTLALGTIVGGRLGYCALYEPDLFSRFTDQFPYWGVLEIQRGGMASHGGMLGIIVAAIWYCRKHSLPTLRVFDLLAVSGPIGIFFGRIANFINGELVGRPTSADLPWAVRFPTDIYAWPFQEPQRLVGLAPIVNKLGIAEASTWDAAVQANPYAHIVRLALQQIVTAVQHGNLTIQNMLAPLLTPRHPSQLYEAALEGLLLFIVLFSIWRRSRVPGFTSSIFLILYALLRILGEAYRMPDIQIGFQLFGLTRGQWLSIGMLAVGVCFFIWIWKRSRATTKST